MQYMKAFSIVYIVLSVMFGLQKGLKMDIPEGWNQVEVPGHALILRCVAMVTKGIAFYHLYEDSFI